MIPAQLRGVAYLALTLFLATGCGGQLLDTTTHRAALESREDTGSTTETGSDTDTRTTTEVDREGTIYISDLNLVGFGVKLSGEMGEQAQLNMEAKVDFDVNNATSDDASLELFGAGAESGLSFAVPQMNVSTGKASPNSVYADLGWPTACDDQSFSFIMNEKSGAVPPKPYGLKVSSGCTFSASAGGQSPKALYEGDPEIPAIAISVELVPAPCGGPITFKATVQNQSAFLLTGAKLRVKEPYREAGDVKYRTLPATSSGLTTLPPYQTAVYYATVDPLTRRLGPVPPKDKVWWQPVKIWDAFIVSFLYDGYDKMIPTGSASAMPEIERKCKMTAALQQ